MNWKPHLPLALATAAVMVTLALCTWSIDRHLDATDGGFELGQIDRRLQEMTLHLEAIDQSTCSMDKRSMSAREAFADMARKC